MSALFTSKKTKKAREFNRRGADLLLDVKVYPWGVKKEETDGMTPGEYVEFTLGRPRVQISVDAETAKRILQWQEEALLSGETAVPASFVIDG